MATLYYRDPDTGVMYPVVGGGNDHGGLFGIGDDDHPHYQLRSEKAAASGYASLDSNGDVPFAQIPVGTAANQVASGNHTHTTDGYRPITLSTSAPSGGR